MLSYKKLDVYKCSIQLLALTTAVLAKIGRTKGNAVIADQLKRAALSIPLAKRQGPRGGFRHPDCQNVDQDVPLPLNGGVCNL